MLIIRIEEAESNRVRKEADATMAYGWRGKEHEMWPNKGTGTEGVSIY